MPSKIPNDKLPEHFWAGVDKRGDDECWEWTRSKDTSGYGSSFIRIGDERRASRISWVLMFGEIPNGLKVLHTCDNRACCNPKHLFLGTDQDNVDDMIRKGRHVAPSGDRNGSRTHPEKRPRGDNHWTRKGKRLAETLESDSHDNRPVRTMEAVAHG